MKMTLEANILQGLEDHMWQQQQLDLAYLKELNDLIMCLRDSIKINSGKENLEIKYAFLREYQEKAEMINKRLQKQGVDYEITS
tara:strand:- start:546 stop:797 length:252 start_codon:yes stop_codon:yes gene_type:complete